MVVDMKLDLIPFNLLLSEEKKVELRLFDAKRRRLDIGDYIIFHCGNRANGAENVLAAQVTALYRYATFEDLFSELSPADCGLAPDISPEAAAQYMLRYYSPEEVTAYGVLGIRLELRDLNEAYAQKEAEELARYERLFPDGMK